LTLKAGVFALAYNKPTKRSGPLRHPRCYG